MVKNNKNDRANQNQTFTLEPPAVKVGDWVDTGRYRPAQVLAIASNPPHIMQITYGDGIDEEFYPHLVEWRKISKPKNLKTLKDVFSMGDWVRHERMGNGQILSVRNTFLHIEFGEEESTYYPHRSLSGFKKIKRPAPGEDWRISEHFLPGTWIEHDYVGKGLVLYVEDEILTVYGTKKCAQIIADGTPPVVFKCDKLPMDITRPFERRRFWLWRYKYSRPNNLWPCACCGYPVFTVPSESWESLWHCMICGWINTSFRKGEAYPKTLEVAYLPKIDDDIFDVQEWPNAPYSVGSARETFENTKTMFRADDALHDFFRNTTEKRKEFMSSYDKIIFKDPGSGVVEELDQLHTLAKEIIEVYHRQGNAD